jgi:hypothetical protein
MDAQVNEMTINGVEYVRKDSIKETADIAGDYVIIRTYSAGVFAGNLEKKDGQEVVLKNARRLWYWDGAASLSQMAIDGVSKPQNCKFPEEVNEITLEQVIEIIPCTKKAMNSIKGVGIWKA